MKRAFLTAKHVLAPAFLSLSLLGAGAFAADQADIAKLNETNACENCDLSHADLSNMDLTGAMLKGADMIEVNLSGSDLTDADLTDVRIESSSLREATLCNTTRGADWVDNRDC